MEIHGPDGYRVEATIASTSRERWRGLMWRRAYPLLIRTRSVHGFGLLEPVRLVGIDPDGVVADVRPLLPGRLIWMGGVRWILELPLHVPPPRVGDRLVF